MKSTNAILLVVYVSAVGCNVEAQISATCVMAAGSGVGNVSGTIKLYQPSSTSNVTVSINLMGFNGSSVMEHGFHVHQNALLANSCDAAGPHMNLNNTLHGAPWDPENKRHTGDLGNIPINPDGTSYTTISDWLISLSGPRSVIGQPFVVHSGTDDLGRGNAPTSNTTGNAGARLGCCLIVQDIVVSVLTPPPTPIIVQSSASILSSFISLLFSSLLAQLINSLKP